MLKNLRRTGSTTGPRPSIIQMNKRDLEDARGDAELGDLRRVIQPRVVPAVAVRGEGVLETLHALVLQLSYRSLDRRSGSSRSGSAGARVPRDRSAPQADVKGKRSQLAEAPAR